MRAAALLLVLAACEPVWGVDVRVHHPGHVPVEHATVAVACAEGQYVSGEVAIRTSPDGKAFVGGIGGAFPVGCDVYVAKPGFQMHPVSRLAVLLAPPSRLLRNSAPISLHKRAPAGGCPSG